MNLLQLRTAFRVDVDDILEPYLFTDAQFLEWINEAQDEACIRANLLFESTDEGMCLVTLEAGERGYIVDEKWHVITKAYIVGDECPLTLTSREDLDRRRPRWRQDTDRTRELMVFDGRIELDVATTVERTLQLEGFRLPKSPMKADGSKPEIARMHHRSLVEWARYRAYSRPDSESFDPARAARSEQAFAAVFGLRPEADMRRHWYEDTPHVNHGFWA